jgi:hypothetical protein
LKSFLQIQKFLALNSLEIDNTTINVSPILKIMKTAAGLSPQQGLLNHTTLTEL